MREECGAGPRDHWPRTGLAQDGLTPLKPLKPLKPPAEVYPNGHICGTKKMAGPTGFEPATSRLTIWRPKPG